MRVAFATLGCKINQYETSLMCEDLRDKYEIVSFDKQSDIYIINTCTVTHKADYQSRQLIRRAIKRNQNAKIIATGCYAERAADDLKALGVHLVTGNSGKDQILEILNHLLHNSEVGDSELGFLRGATVRCKAAFNTGRTRAFLKIQDGCNYNCSYCIVPIVRGTSRSAYSSDVFNEVSNLIENGYREVVISGIQLGSYGRDFKTECNLLDLIRQLIDIKGLYRLRLSSIEPVDITSGLINLMKSDPRICRHLHVPIQSGDDDILKAMGRNYNASYYRELIMSLVSEIPDIGIGTDVMVGFPGESDAKFINTYNMLEQLPLSYFHVFTFSQRPGTSIYSIKNKISPADMKRRNRMLRSLGESKNLTFRLVQVGKHHNILLESKIDSSGYSSGLTDNYIRFKLKTSRRLVNNIVNVKADGVEGSCLVGVQKN